MTIWYTARGAGLATLVMLTLATTLGALGSRKTAAVDARVVLQYVHRAAAVLGLSLLILHVSTILIDGKAGVGVVGALVPFASSYRPGAVALGSISAYLFLTISALGIARGRLAGSPRGARVWRGIHLLAYGGWATAIWHGYTAGSDSGTTWVRLLYLACLISVPVALAVRIHDNVRRGHGRRAMGPVTGLVRQPIRTIVQTPAREGATR